METARSFPLVLAAVFCLLPAINLGQTGISNPPGAQAESRAQDQFEKSIPPPIQVRPKADAEQVQRDAEELAGLAQSVPVQVRQLNRGMLPKELIEKLKRIEKLSRQLRNEINQK